MQTASTQTARNRKTAWSPRLPCIAVLACLTGCGALPAATNNAGKPDVDSMAAECPLEVRYANPARPDAALPELKTLAEARLARLHLKAVWETPEADAFTDSASDRLRLRRLLSVVLPALERYPAVLFERMRLTSIALVKNLRVAGQVRRAMPAPETSSVIYSDNEDDLCPAGMEARVHHEFYHFIEYRLFGDFYYRDPLWLALNPSGTSYGNGGATAYGTRFLNLGHPVEGMVSRYAAYGPEEDKAEMFGWMMAPGYARRVRTWTADDAFLAAKRDFMVTLFKVESGGVMDEAYFARLAQPAAALGDQ